MSTAKSKDRPPAATHHDRRHIAATTELQYDRNSPRESAAIPASEPRHEALASWWARGRVEELSAQDWQGMQSGTPRADLREQILELLTSHGGNLAAVARALDCTRSMLQRRLARFGIDPTRHRGRGEPPHE